MADPKPTTKPTPKASPGGEDQMSKAAREAAEQTGKEAEEVKAGTTDLQRLERLNMHLQCMADDFRALQGSKVVVAALRLSAVDAGEMMLGNADQWKPIVTIRRVLELMQRRLAAKSN